MPLSPQILAAARALEVRARRSVREGLGGRWRSGLRGAGIEFAEVRDYVPGDDARTLDWNVTARAGRLTVKRFEEEREQTLFFVVDLSASCLLGGGRRSWREAAAELVAMAGCAAAHSGDRCGLALATDRIERIVAPRHGANHALALATEVLSHAPAGRRSDPRSVAREFLRLRTRPALVFWIGDGADEWPTESMAEVAARHDLVLSLLRGPWADPPRGGGIVRFADPESGAVRRIDLGDARVHAELVRRIARVREDAARQARRVRADAIEFTVDEPSAPRLAEWCRRRERERLR